MNVNVTFDREVMPAGGVDEDEVQVHVNGAVVGAAAAAEQR